MSTLQAGCFVGALAAYWFADRIGRKPSLCWSALFALIGTVLQAASSGYLACLYVGRFAFPRHAITVFLKISNILPLGIDSWRVLVSVLRPC